MTPAEILQRGDTLKSLRRTFDWHWQEVADYCRPDREFTRTTAPGMKRMTRIYNTTPISAGQQLAAGLHGMLTSPALRWFVLKAEGLRDEQWGGDDPAEAWFEAATEAMYAVFNSPRAGFNTAAHELYIDIAHFGNGVLFVGDAGKKGPIFRTVPLAECHITTDGWGRVDGLWRLYKQTARQIMATPGWASKAPRPVREAAEKAPDTPFEVVHAVYPEPGDGYASCYVLRDGAVELESGMFREFPYVFARWARRSGEDYGVGPAMDALPDIKLINKVEEVKLRGVQLAVAPPMAIPDDGFLGPLVTQPFGINFYRAGDLGQDRVFPLYQGGRVDIAMEEIAAIEARIERMFHVTWMNLPTRPNMTATEVLQRRDEMLRLLGPMVARLQQEFLGPLIERAFAIMWRNGLLPPPPEELSGAGWHIEYLSPLALSQKASDADAVLRWWSAVAGMAQVDPSVLDVADAPQAARYLADRYGAPQRVVRAPEEAQALADQRAEQQQAAMMVQGAQGVARAAKDGAGAVQAMAPAEGMPA